MTLRESHSCTETTMGPHPNYWAFLKRNYKTEHKEGNVTLEVVKQIKLEDFLKVKQISANNCWSWFFFEEEKEGAV